MTKEPSYALLAFVSSRIPMLEHDVSVSRQVVSAGFGGNLDVMKRGRRFSYGYSLKQACFYQADWYVEFTPRVSEKALAYAAKNWGERATDIWGLRRSQLVKLEGRPISESGLIYEHVFTGRMFKTAIETMFDARGGSLDAWEVATLLQQNYATAWITREEDKVLPRSDRGRTLADALAIYERCGVRLAAPPDPTVSKSFALKQVEEEELEVAEERAAKSPETRPVNTFFVRVQSLLEASDSGLSASYSGDRKYARVISTQPTLAFSAGYLELRGRGAVRDVFVSFELPTQRPFAEPLTANWRELRERLGDGWDVSFGKHNHVEGRLCRLRRRIADGFHTDHATVPEIEQAVQAAVAEIVALADAWSR